MPKKDYVLEGGLAVTIYKRKTSRHLRLSISSTGQIRVSIPAWAPYRMGLEFANSRQSWIASQPRKLGFLGSGQPIGKAHHLSFKPSTEATKASSRINGTEINITYPAGLSLEMEEVQAVAMKACIRALRQQAEQLLPSRLADLATSYGFDYRTVNIKRLKSRWGSCDQNGNIVLNLFLMQLPWELIDYVILHELTHTKILHHGPLFWRAMSELRANVKQLRKDIRTHSPVLDLRGGP